MINYNTFTDQQLLDLLKQGDKNAFTTIFDRYNKVLYSHVFNKIREDEAARDLVQDVFVILWEKRKLVQNINLSGYLFTMCRNKILNLLSHHKIVSAYASSMQNFVQPDADLADELIREKQLSAIIDAEIQALPPKMRAIFILSRFEHLSNKEIAKKLGLSEHTVADQIKKSLKTLRHKIGLSVLMSMMLQPDGAVLNYEALKTPSDKNYNLLTADIPDQPL